MEENRILKDKLTKNDELLSKLLNKIEPKILEKLPIIFKTNEETTNKQRSFRINSAPSEKYLKGLYKIDGKKMTHKEKSQSICQTIKIENKQIKRNTESLHNNTEFLATFNPNSTHCLFNLKDDVRKNFKAKQNKDENDCSNTPSFHTKNSYESSISTNIENSFGTKSAKIKEFSFFDINEFGFEEKKKTNFPKDLFQFLTKKNKFFI